MRVAVLLFPGMNCEDETLRALESVGLDARLVPAHTGERELLSYDGFVLPGGFSHEDRIRAGVVAAKHPVMETVARAAEEGRAVAGICNGAQILLEAGLVPALEAGRVEMALAVNDSGSRTGYYCDWRTVVADFAEEPVPLPFAHAEGRFVTADEEVRRRVLAEGLIAARYCDQDGKVVAGWPVNPNGAWENAAAIRNPQGNVLAIMPHPERANWAWQVPVDTPGRWGEIRRSLPDAWTEEPGPGRDFFRAFARMTGVTA